MDNINKFLVRDETGVVNTEATVEKFRDALVLFLVEKERETAEIAHAVNAVFDQHRGARINMSAVATLSLDHLTDGKNIAKLDYLTEAVKGYVYSNAVSEENPNGLFQVAVRGRNAGIRRVSDLQPAS